MLINFSINACIYSQVSHYFSLILHCSVQNVTFHNIRALGFGYISISLNMCSIKVGPM